MRLRHAIHKQITNKTLKLGPEKYTLQDSMKVNICDCILIIPIGLLCLGIR